MAHLTVVGGLHVSRRVALDSPHYHNGDASDARQSSLETEVIRHAAVTRELNVALEHRGHHVLSLVAIDLTREGVV